MHVGPGIEPLTLQLLNLPADLQLPIFILTFIREWKQTLTCLDILQCSNNTEHVTFHRNVLDQAPVPSIPQSHDIIRKGQQEGLKGSYDRA